MGGAAFIPIVLGGVGVSWMGGDLPLSLRSVFFCAAIALYGVGLIDDWRSCSRAIRMVIHLFSATAFLAVAAHAWRSGEARTPSDLARIFSPPSPGFWLLAIWIIGFLNIYNFMDGIDGIAGLQAIVAGIGWTVIAGHAGARGTAVLAACLAAGALGFLTMNWPPARIFMGDAGSTVIGFILAVLPLLLVLESNSESDLDRYLLAASLVVWPFLADGAFTIVRRIGNGENILEPHCSHLYQRLVGSGAHPFLVTSIYGALAVSGCGWAWLVISRAAYARIGATLWIAIAFSILWRWVVMRERAVEAKNGMPKNAVALRGK